MGKSKRKKSYANLDEWFIWVFLTIIVFAIAITYYPDAIMLDTDIGFSLTRLFPTLLLICIGIYMLYTTDKIGRFGGTMSLGIGLCLFLDQATTEGIISADMLVGLTLVQVQVWVMVVSVIFGAVLFSAK